ncbi:hypothetical protein, conserved [Babesia ovata]|uniref:Uncharacterized protein n=1 Tax=Babesia ovata TaxID=189622 RepID=A0A2H6K6D9_9APIC|nr:uncharacterized protein BOVATA_000430 [Babesia ovata]GBE58550.1 hypothetical protein, conserved [Babesia ovata]
MVRQPKKLTDCPENLRESIDWLIQVKHGNGNDGLQKLADALKKLIGDAIKKADESLKDRKAQLECAQDPTYPHCMELKDKIAKANGDEKYRLQSKYNGHYSEVHGSESKRKEALEDITERQKNLDGLKTKLNIFTDENHANEVEKLLTNLTDGLEKFLGFNSESKGYTGDGIVYSDLDRLCDGVMAFLHGVLSGVRDDDAEVP